ncbi:MAG: DUF3108 domain-containing protein [Devosiaceae bacterium]|nr:DUF3108 domain-containing protein [Devosiaceae bacterium MH13]
MDRKTFATSITIPFGKTIAALAIGAVTFMGSTTGLDRTAQLPTLTGPTPAHAAASRLRVSYAARLAGIRIGTGVLSVNMEGNRYTASLQARTSAAGRLVSRGQGEAVARGTFQQRGIVPASYDLSASEADLTNVVRMRLRGGDIRELSAEPPLNEHPQRVAVRDQHRRDVVDPVSALLMPVPNAESAMGPAACDRTIPLFDGRQRYDLALSFVRMEQTQFGNGQAAVCRLRYRPIAGHRSNRRVNQELAANPNIFVWLTQVGDGALVAPVRFELGLDFGTLSIQALEFAAQ